MASWHKVSRADWIIQDRFEPIWFQCGGPVKAALFGQYDLRTKTTDFYFTPEAVQIAEDLVEEFGAIPCDRPDMSSLALLVGDQSIIEGNG